MKGNKKSIALITIGSVNVIHALLHIIQFIQSLLMVNEATSKHSFLSELLHNPIFAIIWGVIGLITLFIGIKDFTHHKKCNH
jgi:hypothetical protein